MDSRLFRQPVLGADQLDMKKALMVVSILSIGIVAALGLLYNQSLLFVAFFGLMILMHVFGHGHSSSSSHDESAGKEGQVEEEHPSHEGH